MEAVVQGPVCIDLQVHHPHAVRFFGACTKRQPYMIVTEYLPGGRCACCCETNSCLACKSSNLILYDSELPRHRVVLDCPGWLAPALKDHLNCCSLADLFKRVDTYFPSMRRAVCIALDCAKGMSYLHCHK